MKGLCGVAVTHYKYLVDNSHWPPLTTVANKQANALPEILNAPASMNFAFQAIIDKLKLLWKDMRYIGKGVHVSVLLSRIVPMFDTLLTCALNASALW